MFNKKLKIRAGILALAMAFLTVLPVKAISIADVLSEEASIIGLLRRSPNDVNAITQWQVNRILNKIETEKPFWRKCLHDVDCSTNLPERDHPELYYLWLVERFDKIYNLLKESDSRSRLVLAFMGKLLDSVFEINEEVYERFELRGWSAMKLRGKLTGTPSYYVF